MYKSFTVRRLDEIIFLGNPYTTANEVGIILIPILDIEKPKVEGISWLLVTGWT